MSVFLKVAFAAVVIFSTGGYGLYYLMSDGSSEVVALDTTSKNNKRRLSLSENLEQEENEEAAQLRARREVSQVNTEPQGDSEEEEDEEGEEKEVTRGNVQAQQAVKSRYEINKELEAKWGLPVQNKFEVRTKIPAPKDRNYNPIRERQFLFDSVARDNKFSERELKKLSEDFVVNKFKKYLILAEPNHELWDIKFRQLKEYFINENLTWAGSYNFGYLYKNKATKKELASKCFKAYKTDPGSSVMYSFLWSGTVTEDYNSIWNWCTLPQYWGKIRPTNWPGK